MPPDPDPSALPHPAPAARGRFITLEGGEGAGKSTQIRILRGRLEALGLAVVATREPGGSPRAEAIREALLSGKAEAAGPEAETALFAAARADHVATLIAPALARGAWVLCDRFADSTRVYQGLAGVDHKLIRALERMAVGAHRPDLTLILDIPAKLGLQRAAVRRGAEAADRFEKDGLAIHEARRDAFLRIAAAEPDRVTVVSADGTPEAVAERIWSVIEARFRDALPPASAPSL